MKIEINTLPKLSDDLFQEVRTQLTAAGFTIESEDLQRPWGGFYVFAESDAPVFAAKFFPEIDPSRLFTGGKLSPKFLMVKPGQRLSWQYHHRRAEWWKTVSGTAGVVRSNSDEEGVFYPMPSDQTVHLPCGERHRLVGLEEWAVVAEIWQHADPNHPSDESDIVRLQDDFGR